MISDQADSDTKVGKEFHSLQDRVIKPILLSVGAIRLVLVIVVIALSYGIDCLECLGVESAVRIEFAVFCLS